MGGLKKTVLSCFTHNDPFEDTESYSCAGAQLRIRKVSPTTIRSRILKGNQINDITNQALGFTHNDPFEDTESSIALVGLSTGPVGFTHNDPFEDTESFRRNGMTLERKVVSPTTIRSRILKEDDSGHLADFQLLFHPQRSVRGY